MRRKNFKRFLVAVVATLVVCSSAVAQETLHLTLQDALKVALSENISVKVADKDYTYEQILAHYFPGSELQTI